MFVVHTLTAEKSVLLQGHTARDCPSIEPESSSIDKHVCAKMIGPAIGVFLSFIG